MRKKEMIDPSCRGSRHGLQCVIPTFLFCMLLPACFYAQTIDWLHDRTLAGKGAWWEFGFRELRRVENNRWWAVLSNGNPETGRLTFITLFQNGERRFLKYSYDRDTVETDSAYCEGNTWTSSSEVIWRDKGRFFFCKSRRVEAVWVEDPGGLIWNATPADANSGIYDSLSSSWLLPPANDGLFRLGNDFLSLRIKYQVKEETLLADTLFSISGTTPLLHKLSLTRFNDAAWHMDNLVYRRLVGERSIVESETEYYQYSQPIADLRGSTVMTERKDTVIKHGFYFDFKGELTPDHFLEIDNDGMEVVTERRVLQPPKLYQDYNREIVIPGLVAYQLVSRDHAIMVPDSSYPQVADSAFYLVQLSIGKRMAGGAEVMRDCKLSVCNFLSADKGCYVYSDEAVYGPYKTVRPLFTGLLAVSFAGEQHFYSSGGKQLLKPGQAIDTTRLYWTEVLPVMEKGQFILLDLISLKALTAGPVENFYPLDPAAAGSLAVVTEKGKTGLLDVSGSVITGQANWLITPGKGIQMQPGQRTGGELVVLLSGKKNSSYQVVRDGVLAKATELR